MRRRVENLGSTCAHLNHNDTTSRKDTTMSINPLDRTRDALARLAAFQGNAAARDYVASWADALGNLPSGTMRAWFTAHDGASVETLQLDTRGLDAAIPAAWAPGGRTVDASRSTYVRLDHSRRDYAGMTVLATSDDALVVADEHHVVLFRLTS